MSSEENKIKHNESGCRFELEKSGFIAFIEYKKEGKKIIFTHTKVPKELEGKGIGSALVKYALDYALQNHLIIVPKCPFVGAYMNKHPEYLQN